CLLAVLLNGVAAVLGTWGLVLSLPLLVLIFIWIWWLERRRRATRLRYQFVKEPPQSAHGLILLVSPYEARSKDPQLSTPEEVDRQINTLLQKSGGWAEADFAGVNLANSNLAPLLGAVAYHAGQGTLREVWLITTRTELVETGQGASNWARGSEV